jgi:hypothetical protein
LRKVFCIASNQANRADPPITRITASIHRVLGDVLADSQRALQVRESTTGGIRISIAPPTLNPPIDFHYLNKERIDALFSQIQATLVEKERTVSTSWGE